MALPCAAQGYPVPTYRWYKKEGMEKILLMSTLNERLAILDGTLVIQDIKIQDSGIYVCIANNSVGEERGEVELIVKGTEKNIFLEYVSIPSPLLARLLGNWSTLSL